MQSHRAFASYRLVAHASMIIGRHDNLLNVRSAT